MSDAPSIRPAIAADAGAVAKVLRQSFRHALPQIPELHTKQEDLWYCRAQIFPKNWVYVAEDPSSGRILGFIAFDDAWINHLYILPDAIGHGLGTRLLSLAQAKCTHLQLWTFQANKPARKFYERHGFTVVKETDGADNDEKEPDILYQWSRPESIGNAQADQ